MDFAILAFMFVSGLGILTYLCLPKSEFRMIATLTFLTMTVGTFVAGIETLGLPKPISLEWREFQGDDVAGMIWDEENRLVYVWAMRGSKPVSYAFPWPENPEEADDMQDRWRNREESGDRIVLSGSEGGEDGDIAEVLPEEPNPPKD